MGIDQHAGAAGAVLPRITRDGLGRRRFGGGIAQARSKLGEPRARWCPGRDRPPGASAAGRIVPGRHARLPLGWELGARSATPDVDAFENDPSPANSPWPFVGWLYVVLMVAGLLFGSRITIGFSF
jgi:hypothetical protein